MTEPRGELSTALREFGGRITKLEHTIASNHEVVLLKLSHLAEAQDITNERLKELNGEVRLNDKRITVLERFCDEQMKPALEALINVRLELARWGLFGGGIGIVAAVGFGIGKLAAWW